jgi:hypothetical protein
MVPYVAFGHRNDRIVEPFPPRSIVTHLYVTYDTYLSIPKPEKYKTFFVMRDPRDLVVSWYFSAKYSHRLEHPITEMRKTLKQYDHKIGLEFANFQLATD